MNEIDRLKDVNEERAESLMDDLRHLKHGWQSPDGKEEIINAFKEVVEEALRVEREVHSECVQSAMNTTTSVVIAEERKACAKVAEEYVYEPLCNRDDVRKGIAQAIRSRK